MNLHQLGHGVRYTRCSISTAVHHFERRNNAEPEYGIRNWTLSRCPHICEGRKMERLKANLPRLVSHDV